MPFNKGFCNKKSSRYLSHVIGHEGPNSLLSFLIKNSLATSLSSGNSQRLNDSIDIFSLRIQLTDKGETNYHAVIKNVYMFINQIKKEGLKSYIYEEF
jgi:insulysin